MSRKITESPLKTIDDMLSRTTGRTIKVRPVTIGRPKVGERFKSLHKVDGHSHHTWPSTLEREMAKFVADDATLAELGRMLSKKIKDRDGNSYDEERLAFFYQDRVVNKKRLIKNL